VSTSRGRIISSEPGLRRRVMRGEDVHFEGRTDRRVECRDARGKRGISLTRFLRSILDGDIEGIASYTRMTFID